MAQNVGNYLQKFSLHVNWLCWVHEGSLRSVFYVYFPPRNQSADETIQAPVLWKSYSSLLFAWLKTFDNNTNLNLQWRNINCRVEDIWLELKLPQQLLKCKTRKITFVKDAKRPWSVRRKITAIQKEKDFGKKYFLRSSFSISRM